MSVGFWWQHNRLPAFPRPKVRPPLQRPDPRRKEYNATRHARLYLCGYYAPLVPASAIVFVAVATARRKRREVAGLMEKAQHLQGKTESGAARLPLPAANRPAWWVRDRQVRFRQTARPALRQGTAAARKHLPEWCRLRFTEQQRPLRPQGHRQELRFP
jgi:hypothetical protein